MNIMDQLIVVSALNTIEGDAEIAKDILDNCNECEDTNDCKHKEVKLEIARGMAEKANVAATALKEYMNYKDEASKKAAELLKDMEGEN